MKESNILDQFQGFLDTPDIFSENHRGDLTTFSFPEVQITDELIADLKKLDHPRNSVLGKRMESFFEVAIKHSDRYELIASNIQIIANKQTLGELDFLIYDRLYSKPLHIELVYKLYIYDKTFPLEINRWIGPNRRDSLYEKFSRLKSRQFPLLYKSETSEYLSDLNISTDKIEQQLCFKAQLFTEDSNIISNPELVNLDCIAGHWYHFNDFLKKAWKDNLFYSPKKKDWSCNPEHNLNWISQNELLDTINSLFSKNKASLVWMKTKTSYHKFFIVWW